MAKRKVNKSAAIRESIEKLGGQDAKPQAVVEALAGQGLKVSTGLVSNIKHAMKKKGKKRGRVAGKASGNGAAISLHDLIAAKKLVEQVGSVDAAASAVAALAKLQ
ncbi:MAG: hypothetical protein AB7U73_17265 [Pirellulales bacterium]